MVKDSDWRLNGQDEYLSGKTLFFRRWRQTSPDWDHDHCDFCWEKFSLSDDAQSEGYCCADREKEYWICKECFEDFRESFGWKLIDPDGIERLYGNMLLTLKQCSGFLLSETDEGISVEFAAGCEAFLSKDSLDILIAGEKIDTKVYDICTQVREKYLDIEENYPQLLILENAKRDERWLDLVDLCEEGIRRCRELAFTHSKNT